MNQLFNNDGYLTPEKRCSKGYKQYRYEHPKEYKVLARGFTDNKVNSVLFPVDYVSVPLPLDPRPLSSYKDFMIYSYPKWNSQIDNRLTESIDSTLHFVKEAKRRNIMSQNNKILKTRRSNNFAFNSMQQDINTIKELSEELIYLKKQLNDKMTISELS